METFKLICFPFAGGTSNFFLRWKQYLTKSIQLIPVELAGRGKRTNDPFCTNMDEMVNDVYNQICGEIEDCQYAIFGHSMGSLIAIELIKKIANENKNLPLHIFFSGKNPPHVEDTTKKITHLPEDQFINEIIRLGGTSKEVFEFEELRNLVLPILLADYKLVEDYTYSNSFSNRLKCDFTVLYGKHDPFTTTRITEWCNYTEGKCRVHEFNGGHFFINDNPGSIVKIINETLVSKENACLS